MTKIGTVDRIRRNTLCFLAVTGEEDRFAHLNDFINPEDMKVGQKVQFTPIEVNIPGKYPFAAINVRAIAA
jgi:cold shock CspA family protein